MTLGYTRLTLCLRWLCSFRLKNWFQKMRSMQYKNKAKPVCPPSPPLFRFPQEKEECWQKTMCMGLTFFCYKFSEFSELQDPLIAARPGVNTILAQDQLQLNLAKICCTVQTGAIGKVRAGSFHSYSVSLRRRQWHMSGTMFSGVLGSCLDWIGLIS